MFRLKIGIAIIGGVMIYLGFLEYRVSSGTSSTPKSVELVDLEKGGELANRYISVGEHIAIYAGSVYSFRNSTYSDEEEGPSGRVSYLYYPIIASQRIRGSDEDLDLSFFTVLVKTKRFETVGSIPETIAHEIGVEGLVINRIASLKTEEKNLIRKAFPRIDTSKILILEEGRRPSPFFFWGGLIVGGVALIVVGLGWLVAGLTSH
ncbi:MAG: hypothetical protein ACI9G1_001618 [Pirellulaceae bacterium]|jgi:hypothetical protein